MPQNPPTHKPEQHPAVVLQAPPSGAHDEPPPDTQVPLWQTPPVQQSALVVQVPLPMAMQLALQENPVGDVALGEQTCEQH
ncbi:MAG: hypothetical protein NVS3B20_14490 [Polyangiales bacterium]